MSNADLRGSFKHEFILLRQIILIVESKSNAYQISHFRASHSMATHQKQIRISDATSKIKHTNEENPSAFIVLLMIRYCGTNGTMPPKTIAPSETSDTNEDKVRDIGKEERKKKKKK